MRTRILQTRWELAPALIGVKSVSTPNWTTSHYYTLNTTSNIFSHSFNFSLLLNYSISFTGVLYFSFSSWVGCQLRTSSVWSLFIAGIIFQINNNTRYLTIHILVTFFYFIPKRFIFKLISYLIFQCIMRK